MSPLLTRHHSAINVEITKLVRANSAGRESNDRLVLHNSALMEFTYDATNATPKPGDSLSIGLPEQFTHRKVGNSASLVFQDLHADPGFGQCQARSSQDR